MQFSVLLSVYKKEQSSYLQQSLDSIFNQTLLPDEVILVKDGILTNELEEVIEKYIQVYSMLNVIPLSQNQGLGKALNEGIQHCSYNLIARMDTDDIAKPDRFEKQIKMFKDYPEIDVVGAWIDEFEDDISKIFSVRKLPEDHKEILKFAKKRNPINHPVVMFRKNAVIEAGGYQHFLFFEDYYLWIRMLMNGARFYNIQESLLFFRSSSDMYKRRGGGQYIKSERAFQYKLYQLHFINFFYFIQNISIRFFARVIPNSWRGILYKKILHK